MSAWLALRLGAWREVRGRWPLLLAGPLATLLPPLLPERLEFGGWAFVLLVIWPVVTVLLAAGGEVAADSFWRGLGGPSWARLGGAMGVHAALVPWWVVCMWGREATFGAAPDFDWGHDRLVSAAAFGGLYASVFAARRLAGGLRLAVGPLVLQVAVVVGAAWTAWERTWPLLEGAALRCLVLALVLVVAGFVADAAVGARHAALRHRVGWGVLGALVLGLGGTAAAEAAWPWAAGRMLRLSSVDESGERAVFLDRWNGYAELGPGGRGWLLEDGRYHRLPDRMVADAAVGPEGGLVVVTARIDQVAARLSGPGGGETRCVLSTEDGWVYVWDVLGWRSDGRAVILGRWGSWAVVLDLDAGCTTVEHSVLDAGWMGDRLAILRGDGLHVGERVYGVPEGARLGAVGSDLYVRGGRAGEAPRLWRVEDGGLRELPAPEGSRMTFEAPGAVCIGRSDIGWSCWREGAEQFELPPKHWLVDARHAMNGQGDVTAIGDPGGARWPFGRAREHRVVGDVLRRFDASGFEDVAADGTVTRHDLPAMDW